MTLIIVTILNCDIFKDWTHFFVGKISDVMHLDLKKMVKYYFHLEIQFNYSRYIGKGDGITISVWNHKKIHKKQGGGFLGCVRIMSNTIQRLKDTGCKYAHISCKKKIKRERLTNCV